MPCFHKAPCSCTCRSHLRNLFLKCFLYCTYVVCTIMWHACIYFFRFWCIKATVPRFKRNPWAYIPQTKPWLFMTNSFIILVTSREESIEGILLLFFNAMCMANYMSSCPCWCSLSHSIKNHQQANCISAVINITCSCNHPRCFIALTVWGGGGSEMIYGYFSHNISEKTLTAR